MKYYHILLCTRTWDENAFQSDMLFRNIKLCIKWNKNSGMIHASICWFLKNPVLKPEHTTPPAFKPNWRLCFDVICQTAESLFCRLHVLPENMQRLKNQSHVPHGLLPLSSKLNRPTCYAIEATVEKFLMLTLLSAVITSYLHKSYPDSSSSPYLPPRLNSKHYPPQPSDCLPAWFSRSDPLSIDFVLDKRL